MQHTFRYVFCSRGSIEYTQTDNRARQVFARIRPFVPLFAYFVLW